MYTLQNLTYTYSQYFFKLTVIFICLRTYLFLGVGFQLQSCQIWKHASKRADRKSGVQKLHGNSCFFNLSNMKSNYLYLL